MFVHTLRQELRQAIRSLAKNPGFVLLAVTALALGIGANTAIFSVVNSVLLRPLAYADPAHLTVILHDGNAPVSPADFMDWRQQARSYEKMAAAQAWGATLTGGDHAEAIPGMQVTADMFHLLGVPPLYGRTFNAGDDSPSAAHIVVLSYPLWQRRFGSDPAIVGRQITLNGESYTVAGVMPESFRFAPFWSTTAEMWTPLVLAPRIADRGGRSLRIFARLRSGVSLQQAQAEIDVICRRLAEQYPATNTNLTAQVVPLQEKVVANIRPMLLILLGTVGFVLLIACSNVANLMMVRASGKQRETAVRLALGSGRWRLIRHSLVESMLLALTGAAAGAAIASWGVKALMASLPPRSLPRLQEVGIDKTVLGFTVLLALATGIVSGLAPAFRSFGTDLQEALKSGGRSSTHGRGENRTRGFFVMAEVALALILLVGAGLMLRTFEHLQAVDPGFDARHLLTLDVIAGGTAYPTPASRIRFFENLRPRLDALPGVESASIINHLPIGGDIWTLGLTIADRATPPPGQVPSAAYRVVQPGYFHTMKIRLLQGRDFNDHEIAPVAIVNEALAKRHWPGEDPLGRRVSLDKGTTWMTVVGVIHDVVQTDWTAKPAPEIYLPHSQAGAFSYMTVVMRAHGDPLLLAKATTDTVHSLDKDVAIPTVHTMEQVIGDRLWRSRLSMMLLGLFAVVAVTLAAVGIYGVVSYSVAQRTSEIGIRMALGARAGDVLGMILRQGLAVVGGGIAIGLLGAWLLTRTLSGLLYGVTTTDPVTFIAVPLLLAALSTLACSLPALRASKVDPLTALRQE